MRMRLWEEDRMGWCCGGILGRGGVDVGTWE